MTTSNIVVTNPQHKVFYPHINQWRYENKLYDKDQSDLCAFVIYIPKDEENAIYSCVIVDKNEESKCREQLSEECPQATIIPYGRRELSPELEQKIFDAFLKYAPNPLNRCT